MCYNVENIIDHVEALVRGASRAEREAIPLEPYYEGFCGTIEPFRRLSAAEKALTKGKGKGKGKGNAQEVAENAENAETEGSTKNYLIRGTHTWLDTYRVHVTELPVGTWTDDFKTHLENLIDKKVMVREYVDMSTDVSVDLVLTMAEKRADVEALSPTVVGISAHGIELFVSELEKTLRLYTTASTNNMHAFDENDKLQRYDTVHDVVEGHHKVRMTGYGRRRDAQLAALQRERLILSNRVRFIMGIIDGDIQINYKKYAEVVVLLDAKGLDRIDGEFKYLTQMPMESVTKENVDRLNKEHDEKVKQYEALFSLSPSEMWLQDLATLRAKYAEYRTQRVAAMRESCIENKTDKKKKSAKGAKSANA
jgi:DNA topoisomerase-2